MTSTISSLLNQSKEWLKLPTFVNTCQTLLMTTELRAWTNGDLDKIVTKTDGYWVEYSDGTRLLDVQSVSYTHLTLPTICSV